MDEYEYSICNQWLNNKHQFITNSKQKLLLCNCIQMTVKNVIIRLMFQVTVNLFHQTVHWHLQTI
jgi:hypothetical protein